MSVTKQKQPVTDPRKMDSEQLDALAQEALDAKVLSEYQCRILEEQMERDMQSRVKRRIERRIEREIEREAERDLQRWLKRQREVDIHRAFAQDYAKYMARISC